MTGEIESLTPYARWQLRRDLVIYLAARGGCSQRLLADVFDLSQPAVCKILRRFDRPSSSVGPTDLAPAHAARDRTGRGGPGDQPRTGRAAYSGAQCANRSG